MFTYSHEQIGKSFKHNNNSNNNNKKMLRRSLVRRFGYHSHDYNQDQMLGNSPFGWNYAMPQNMVSPWRVNRVMTKPFFEPRRKIASYAAGVFVGSIADMDPTMVEALRPWLSKLALGRTVPATDPAEAIEDFKKIAPRIADAKTRRCWLAKVLQLCAMKRNSHGGAADAGVELWKSEEANLLQSSSSSSSPSASSSSNNIETSFAVGVLYCAATSSMDSETFRGVFSRACRGWQSNLSNSSNGNGSSGKFPVKLWDCMLRSRGLANDEASVLAILNELIDVQFDLEVVGGRALVTGLNAVKTPEGYAEVKRLLHNFSPEKARSVSRTYTTMRREAEEAAAAAGGGADEGDTTAVAEGGKHRDVVGARQKPNKSEIIPTDNDAMFYHVMWHDRVRHPLEFFPRRLYFDFKPSLSNFKSDGEAKRNAKDLISERIARWKEEGLLPEDYDATSIKFFDKQAAVKAALRTEKHKKKPKFLDKPEYGAGQLQGTVAASAKKSQ